jgi:dethiobiotin synthetase
MNRQYFVTGIGTDIGKTVVSAILAEALQAHYWKPIQAGDLENSDSIKVQTLCSNEVTIIEENFRLKTAASPHSAAKIDGINIKLSDLKFPLIEGNLIIEGAGGVMVPINDKGDLFIDYIDHLKLPVIVVSRNYLGSINHTLMTIEALKNKGLEILGIIFNGDENIASENIILKITNLPCIAKIPAVECVNQEFILEQAKKINLDF